MKIFISYRRSDDPSGAGRLFDHLESRFGKGNVFIDVDSNMPLGLDFRSQIGAQVAKADAVLAVIGKDWLKMIREKADDPRDFVRAEIEAALQSGKTLVPVLMGAQMPREEELPTSISQLAYLNGMQVDVGADFRLHAQRLCSKLESSVKAINIDDKNYPDGTQPYPVKKNVFGTFVLGVLWLGFYTGLTLALVCLVAGIILSKDYDGGGRWLSIWLGISVLVRLLISLVRRLSKPEGNRRIHSI